MDTHYVYLDLNHWIYLAQADAGVSGPREYGSALRTLTDLVSRGEVIVPLSAEYLMEVAKIGDDARRRNLAKVMAKLSRGWFLVAENSLLIGELREAVARGFQKQLQGDGPTRVSRRLRDAFAGRSGEAIAPEDDKILAHPEFLEEFLATARVSRPFVDRWRQFAEDHEKGRQLR